MKKKFLLIIFFLIILAVAIIGVIFYIKSNDSKSENKDNDIDWGETYIAILKDSENFDDLENSSIQLADFDEDSVPEMIIYGNVFDEFIAYIYTILGSGETETIKITSDNEFDVKYLYNKEEEKNEWYYIENNTYSKFTITDNSYELEETTYKKSNFKEVDTNVNKKVEYDSSFSEEEIEEIFELAKESYVEIVSIKDKIPESTNSSDDEVQIADFVEYNGDVYFWQLTTSSREETAIYASYDYETSNENQLVKLPESGEKEVIYEGKGYGNITIVNDRIYTYTPSDSEYSEYSYVMSMDLNGENVKVYDDLCGEMKAISGNLIICEATYHDGHIFSINTDTDEIVEIVDDANYIGNYQGIVYYVLDYYTEYQNTKEKYLKVGTITDGENNGISTKIPMSIFDDSELMYDDVSNFEIFDFLGYDEYVYVSYGWRAGSGNFKQDEATSRISIEDGTIEESYQLTSEDLAIGTGEEIASIFLYENSGKTYVMIASFVGINVDTFEKETVEDNVEKYGAYGVGSYFNSTSHTVNYVEELTRENCIILASDELSSHGFDILDSEYYTVISSESETDQYIYLIIDQGLHDSSSDEGWRYSYKRTNTLAVRYDKEAKDTLVLYEFK